MLSMLLSMDLVMVLMKNTCLDFNCLLIKKNRFRRLMHSSLLLLLDIMCTQPGQIMNFQHKLVERIKRWILNLLRTLMLLIYHLKLIGEMKELLQISRIKGIVVLAGPFQQQHPLKADMPSKLDNSITCQNKSS